MEKLKQDDSEYVQQVNNKIIEVKFCQKHKTEQIAIINIQQGIGAENRLQCIECQYNQIRMDQKVNFIPLKKLENISFDEVGISTLYNWPIVNVMAKERLNQLSYLQKRAESNIQVITDTIDKIQSDLIKQFEEYKKNALIFYNNVISEISQIQTELSDIDTLKRIKDILDLSESQNISQTSKELDEIIENNYKNLSSFSDQIIEQYESIELDLNKYDNFTIELQNKSDKIIMFIEQFMIKKNEVKKQEFNLIKSLGRESYKLNITTNNQKQTLIQKLTDFYGWCYSTTVLDNSATYEIKFSFDNEIENYILIGLIPEEHKDTDPPGQGQSHYCKIFGDNNNFYCGQIKQGDLIEKNITKNDIITMKVCIKDGILQFQDEKNNINVMNDVYSFKTYVNYRFCFQFGSRSKNTIRIHSFLIIDPEQSHSDGTNNDLSLSYEGQNHFDF